MNKTAITATAILVCLSVSFAQADGISTFRDCKNITDAIKMGQLKKKGELSKDFLAKVGPAANKLMELCADAKYLEADIARKELEKITGPIDVSAIKNGPVGAGGPR